MNNQINLVESLNTSQILVGLDLGTKTLGVAVSDRFKIIASPLYTIQRNGSKKDLLKLQEILNDYEIGGFIVGLPLSLDNSENQQTQLVKNFNKELIDFFNLPSVFWDERFSTSVIQRIMIEEADLTRKKRAKVIDQLSAVYILQGFLDFLSNSDPKK